jgi:hypothetical protein
MFSEDSKELASAGSSSSFVQIAQVPHAAMIVENDLLANHVTNFKERIHA